MQDIDALLFDLGGVIVDVDFARVTRRWAQLAGHDAETLRCRFSLDDAYAQHERGAIDARAYFQSLRSSLGIDITDAEFLDGWNAIFGGVIPGIEPLLARAADRLRLYLFSNSNPTHEKYWVKEYARTLAPFRRVFVSSSLGLRKPDKAAFDRVASEIGVAPHRILFFDDSVQNVAGARAAGLKAVLVRSTGDVAEALSALL
jgi:putative hydrolase of the HAD superfamily